MSGEVTPAAALLLAWLATFAVHALLLVTAVWAVGRWVRRLPEPVAEVLWKTALVGALITATVQVALVPAPLGGHVARLLETPVERVAGPAPVIHLIPGTAATLPSVLDVPAGPPAATRDRIETPAAVPWALLLLLGAFGTAGAGLFVHGLRRLRFRSRLRGRLLLADPTLRCRLQALAARAGCRIPRLTVSAGVTTPVAFGILRPEICLPPGFVQHLEPASLQGVLAHEIAHLARRDPLWLALSNLLTALFPWLPVLRLPRRKLRELAEFRCDAFAASATGPVPFARCLLEVASWLTLRPREAFAACGMAVSRSALRRRVERLLGAADRPQAVGRHAFWVAPLVVCLLTSLAAALPGLDHRRLPEPGAATGVTRSPEAPEARITRADLGLVLDAVDGAWEELLTEIAALDRALELGPPDAGLLAVRAELDRRLASFDAHRQTIRTLIERMEDAPAGASGMNDTGDSR